MKCHVMASNLNIFYFFVFLDNWLSSAQLKDIWKIKGIVNEPNTIYEPDSVELSGDDQEPTKQISSHSNSNENEDDEDESCDGDNTDSSEEVCGAITSNKFAALDISE